MDVSFEEENRYAGASATATKTGLIGLVIRMGVAKDAKQAQQVLIGVLIFCVVAVGAVWFFAGGSEPSISPNEYMERARNAGQVPVQ